MATLWVLGSALLITLLVAALWFWPLPLEVRLEGKGRALQWSFTILGFGRRGTFKLPPSLKGGGPRGPSLKALRRALHFQRGEGHLRFSLGNPFATSLAFGLLTALLSALMDPLGLRKGMALRLEPIPWAPPFWEGRLVLKGRVRAGRLLMAFIGPVLSHRPLRRREA